MKSTYSLDDLRYFCAVVRLGSFKEAANALNMPLSTLSRRINQLESDLGLRLLNRNAHRVTMTNIGERYYERSYPLFEELSLIDEDLHKDKHHAKGKIRISAPTSAGQKLLSDTFYDFLLQYPDIQIDLSFSNDLIDIDAEGIDITFRVNNPIVDNWIARPLRDIHFILCAHPEQDITHITSPEKLDGHSTIIGPPIVQWELENKQTREEQVYYPQKGCRLEVDDVFMLPKAVKAGLGIGFIPDYVALPMIKQGEMSRVLPHWQSKARTIFMLYRDRDHLPMRVRLFVEFTLKRFQDLEAKGADIT